MIRIRLFITALLAAAPFAVAAACPPTICLASTPAAGSTIVIDGYTADGGIADSNYGIAIGLFSQAGLPGQTQAGAPCGGTSATGSYTNCSQTALGNFSKATGLSSTAIGAGATASGDNATALGESATASGDNSTAAGNGATAIGDWSTATGMSALALNSGATANGALSNAAGVDSSAVGFEAQALGANSTALGAWADASGNAATALGSALATGANSTAVGEHAKATGANSTATGQGSTATAVDSTALGQGSDAQASGSVALGQGSVATQADTVSVGNAATGYQRRITNVAAGVATTDAANVGQVQGALDQANAYTNQQFGALGLAISALNGRLYGLAAAQIASSQMAMACGGSDCLSAGWGMADGQGAVAIGYRHSMAHGRAAWTIGVSSSAAGTQVGAGFAIRFH